MTTRFYLTASNPSHPPSSRDTLPYGSHGRCSVRVLWAPTKLETVTCFGALTYWQGQNMVFSLPHEEFSWQSKNHRNRSRASKHHRNHSRPSKNRRNHSGLNRPNKNLKKYMPDVVYPVKFSQETPHHLRPRKKPRKTILQFSGRTQTKPELRLSTRNQVLSPITDLPPSIPPNLLFALPNRN